MNRSLRCLAASLLVSLAVPASAAVFDFSYLTRPDDPFPRPAVFASGKITANLFSGSTYTVTGITGMRAGIMITGFDDLDALQTFTLTSGGAVDTADFAYRIGTIAYDVFGGPFIFTEDPIDPDTFMQVEPARTLASLSITPSVAAVPEPASWAMMIGGVGLVGGAMRRRRAAPATPAFG